MSERSAAPWCERCAWGIDVYQPPRGTGWWRRRTGAFSHRIAYRLTMTTFSELSRNATPFGPTANPAHDSVEAIRPPRRWSGPRLAAVGFAVLTYAFIAYLFYLGVRLVLFDFPNLTIVPGVLLILVAVILLPRYPRLPRHIDTLSAERAPTLFALVARVSQAVGTAPPRTIAVTPWHEAWTTSVGLRQRRVLTIGLALFGSLDPQQRVALLAHEMGHFRNGDIRRGLFTQPAMTVLGRLSDLFRGRSLIRLRSIGAGGLGNLVDPLVDLVMTIVSGVFYAAHLGVLAVLLRDSQRREYLADQRAAELAGTRAAAQLFDLLVSDSVVLVAARARSQQDQPTWPAAVAPLLRPENAAKVRRLRQLSVRQEASMWRTHPPTGLRAWLVEAEAWRDPALVLTEAESARIDAELASHYQRARRDLAQSGV